MLKSKFAHFQLFHYLPGWGVGGWGKAENKAKLSPAGAGSWAELGNSGHLRLCQQPMAAHALRSDQNLKPNTNLCETTPTELGHRENDHHYRDLYSGVLQWEYGQVSWAWFILWFKTMH